MQPKGFFILLVGILFATAGEAFEGKSDPKALPEDMLNLKRLKSVNFHNTILDDYHTGSIAYDEPYSLEEKE